MSVAAVYKLSPTLDAVGQYFFCWTAANVSLGTTTTTLVLYVWFRYWAIRPNIKDLPKPVTSWTSVLWCCEVRSKYMVASWSTLGTIVVRTPLISTLGSLAAIYIICLVNSRKFSSFGATALIVHSSRYILSISCFLNSSVNCFSSAYFVFCSPSS